ncbi:hypothetical protein LWC34_35785 [Kibdelosporangium philippinense]|uniref:Tetratricopeptide repeat protein n=1 Tax=Kibdelosporangium philippinense TaxID=211113 RepID=A0ABS8ZND6_9PSEU|nr:hypothetical protein [Kibdelosporangium philippinense]MCE7008141.1 hypothetical protein [Kibdelosporangium philippinense]
MDYPTPELFRHDRLAVAIGNASLLGVGYLLLGRKAWAIVTTLVTVAFLVLLGVTVPGTWFEVLFVVWWAALITHGWYLAGKPGRPAPVRWPRVIALLIAVPVLTSVAYARFDAASIEDNITEARDSGDCPKAQSALDRIWFGHYVVDGPMAVRSENTAAACARLLETARALQVATSESDTRGLQAAYRELDAIRTDLPGHDMMVGTVLNGFTERVSDRDPCGISEITDWLRRRPASNNLLDRPADIVPRIAPAALVACGDDRARNNDWNGAKERYQQLLDQYPGHELTAKAQEGATKAKQSLELIHVSSLGAKYCQTPAAYSGAPAYTKGTANRAVIHHTDNLNDGYIKKLPQDWQADTSQAALVVCIGEREAGAPIRTCRYRILSNGQVRNVTFSKTAYSVKGYELRTGNLVIDTRVEFGGAVCPQTVTVFGDQSRMPAEPADSDIVAAFAPIFTQ